MLALPQSIFFLKVLTHSNMGSSAESYGSRLSMLMIQAPFFNLEHFSQIASMSFGPKQVECVRTRSASDQSWSSFSAGSAPDPAGVLNKSP